MIDAVLRAAPPPVRREVKRAKAYLPMLALVRAEPALALDLARVYTANGLVALAHKIRPT